MFPEYGITGFDQSRDSMVPFLEDIPEPSGLWNSCDEPTTSYPDTKVLHRLSCMAKDHRIYIIANMGDIKYCDIKGDNSCPRDGRYQFNTNVVFDSKGTLISRYHKRNMYDETPLFDPSPTPEYSIFETPFGTFGHIVCFDILNYYPTQVLLEDKGIQNLIVTSAWNVFYPFVLPIQMYSGLAKRNNINVIAANIRNFDYVMASSGIFGANEEVFSDPDFMNSKGELLVAEVKQPLLKDSGTELEPLTGVSKGQGHSGNYDYGMNTTFTILNESKGKTSICSESVCCFAEYEFDMKKADELFILAAAEFSTTYLAVINLQFCAIHKCLSNHIQTCGKTVSRAESTVKRLKIQAVFDNAIVLPFVATSPKENRSINIDMHSYKFDRDRAILESDGFEHPLLSAVVYNSLSFKKEPSIGESTSSASLLHSSLGLLFMLSVCSVYIKCKANEQ